MSPRTILPLVIAIAVVGCGRKDPTATEPPSDGVPGRKDRTGTEPPSDGARDSVLVGQGIDPTIIHVDGVYELSISDDGKRIAYRLGRETLVVRELDGKQPVLSKKMDMQLPSLSGDGKVVCVAGADSPSGLWVVDVGTGRTVPIPGAADAKGRGIARDLRLNRDGNLVVIAGSGRVQFVDTGSGKVRFEGPDDTANARAVSNFFQGGSRVATVHEDGKVHIWEVPTGRLVRSLDTGGPKIHDRGWLSVSEDGRYLATREPQAVWDVAAGKKVWAAPVAGIYDLPVLLPSGTAFLYSGQHQQSLAREVRKVQLPDGTTTVLSRAPHMVARNIFRWVLSADGTTLAGEMFGAGKPHAIVVWKLQGGG